MIARGDLTPGQQAVQAAHAAINFTFEHPARASPWFRDSNTLVLLQVRDEKELLKLLYKAQDMWIDSTAFREPDLNNSLTAIALEPGEPTERLVKNLKLLLYEKSKCISQDDGHQSPCVQ